MRKNIFLLEMEYLYKKKFTNKKRKKLGKPDFDSIPFCLILRRGVEIMSAILHISRYIHITVTNALSTYQYYGRLLALALAFALVNIFH